MNAPPASPTAGQAWIVGAAPTGAWAGHADALAGWTAGGWRFVSPRAGMRVWTGSGTAELRFGTTGWQPETLIGSAVRVSGAQVVGAQQPAIAAPTGGSTVDTAARTAIGQILTALRTHGLIAT